MVDNLRIALDGIRAESELKEKTIRYLQNEIRNRSGHRARNTVLRFAAALASVAAIALAGVSANNLYFAPSAYVDIDVNPSIELTLNQFDRVIATQAYNKEGQEIIANLSLTHQRYEEALLTLINAINQGGFMQNNGLVSVTVQVANPAKEAGMLASIQTDVAGYVAEQHHGVQVEVFSVSGDIQALAHEQNVSPAMYLAIQDLIAVDSSVTVESCRGHSLHSIRQRTQEHMGNHHGEGGGEGNKHHEGGH
ncbi:MAG: hypothetical protein LBI54_04910 [Lachnospiraceae bacterium]|nr:hypothetical protein [Lachnospiraceae bacterium]